MSVAAIAELLLGCGRRARKIRIEPVDHVAHGQHEDGALPDWDVSDEELERLHRAGKL
jgi:hypothetical protein